MTRADKQAAVAELTEAFRESSAAMLTEYRGLTVGQLKQLRTALAGNATYTVVKNTLTKLAAREAGVEGIEELLAGPSAIAFVTGDPVEVAKGLRAFAREHPPLVVKGGVLDGKSLTADELRRLADLESREVLLAKLAGAMMASMQQAVGMFAAPLSQFARLAGALAAKAGEDPSVLAGAATAPGEQPPTAPTPPAAQAAPEQAATEVAPEQAATEVASEQAATGDDGAVAQAVADATDVDPTTDVAGDATSAS